MDKLFKTIVLRQLQKYLPELNSNSLKLALRNGILQLENVIIPINKFNISGQAFSMNGSLEFLKISLTWASLLKYPIDIELRGLKIFINPIDEDIFEDFESDLPQEQRRSSIFQSLISTINIKLTDIEISLFNDNIIFCLTRLQFQYSNNKNRQIFNGQIELINILYKYTVDNLILIELKDIGGDAVLRDQEMVFKIGVKSLQLFDNDFQLAKVKQIVYYQNLSSKVPLLNFEIEKATARWQPFKLHSIIMSLVNLIKETFKLVEEEKVQQTDPTNYPKLLIAIKVQRLKLIFVNREINVGIITGKRGECTIDIQRYFANIEILAKDLIYYDCSNYPFTNPSNIEDGYPLIMAETLQIPIKVFDDYCPKQFINLDQYNFVDINLWNATLYYFQQPFLRFMDFLIEQFIALIIKDFQLKELPKNVILTKLTDPKFTVIKINVEKGIIYAKPLPTSEDSLKVEVQQYTFVTDIQQSKSRIQCDDFPYLWEMYLQMKAQGCQIFYQNQPISNMFDSNIVVSKPAYTLLYIFNKTKFDKTFKVDLKFMDVSLAVDKEIYLAIMRLLFNNVFFDDQKDPDYLYQITTPTPIITSVVINQVKLNLHYNQKRLLKIIAKETEIKFYRNPNNSQIEINNNFIQAYQYDVSIINCQKQQILHSTNSQQQFAKYNQINHKSGFKEIQIEINGVVSIFNLEWLFIAINFFVLDDTMQIVLPFDAQILKPLTLELVIQNIDALMQSTEEQFRAKGNLFLSFQKNQSGDIHERYHQTLHSESIDQISQHIDKGQSSCMKIESSELCLYTRDLSKQLLNPISVQWKSVNYHCLCFKEFLMLNESTLKIEQLKLHLTFTQLKHLIAGITYQTKSMGMACQFGDEDWQQQYSLVSQSRKAFHIDDLEIGIITNEISMKQQNTSQPLITVNLSAMPLLLEQSYMKLVLSSNVILESFYYNQTVGQLEPLIEKFSFDVAMIKNKSSYPRLCVQIEPNSKSKFSQLNINIHQNMLNALFSLYYQKDKQSQLSTMRSSFKSDAETILFNCFPQNIQVQLNNQKYDVHSLSELPLLQFSNLQQLEIGIAIDHFITRQPFKIQQALSKQQIFDVKLTNEQIQNSITISLKILSENGVWYIFLYPKMCLINQTSLPIHFYTLIKDQNHKISRLNQNFTYLHEEQNIVISLEDNYSNEITLNALGDTSFYLKKQMNENQFCLLEFGLNISLMETVKELGVLCRLVEIAPRYVVINNTSSTLDVQQNDSYGNPITINQKARLPFHWQDCTKDKLIVVRVVLNNQATKWSEGFYISELRRVQFYVCKKDSNEKLYLQCTISKAKGTFYILIQNDTPPYKLINKCNQYKIAFAQLAQQMKEELLDQGEEKDYSWTYPSLQPILNIRLKDIQQQQQVTLNLFKSDPCYCFQINPQTKLYVAIEFEENKKIIIFQEEQIDLLNLEQKLTSMFYIKLSMMTISVICNVDTPQELNLITVNQAEFASSEMSSVVSYQIRIKFLHIDNNYSYDVITKVPLTPRYYDTLIESMDKYVFNLKWAQNNQTKHTKIIEYFESQIDPFSIKLDQEYVTLVMRIYQQLKSIIPKDDKDLSQFSSTQYLFHKNREQYYKKLENEYNQEFNPFQEWQFIEVPRPQGGIYIKQLITPLIEFDLSFQTFYQSNTNFVLSILANSLDSAIKNIDNAPIKIKGIKMKNIYDTQVAIKTLLKEHYKFILLQQILPIIGSIEILGNPASFFNRVSTGVVDLIEKPIEAFSQGPLELGMGVMEGTASLLKNTMAGVFYSINKITGGVSNQISLFSLDEEYIQQRRRYMQRKPSQVFEGVYYGVQSLLHGIGDGILGFFTQPYQRGKQEGIIGIVKGSAIGISGMVIKPIAGVFDAASKTAEGLTNTATYFDDRPREERMRFIRAFYESGRYIKAYNEDDAELMNKYYRNGLILIDSFQLFDTELNKNMLLVVSENYLIYLSKQSGIKWQCQSKKIIEFKLFSDFRDKRILRLYLMLEDSMLKLKFQKVPFSSYLGERIQQMIDLNKQQQQD